MPSKNSAFPAALHSFADKTRFIPILEDFGGLAPLFLRPRNFGKTHFTRLLEDYCDEGRSGDFDANFAGTWICSHRTPDAGAYRCLRVDFSGARTEGEMVLALAGALRDFSTRYPDAGMQEDEIEHGVCLSPAELLQSFLVNFFVRARGGKEIFLIIDGYDSFAYKALARGKDAFREAMADLHGSAGAIRDFLATVKAYMATGDGAIAKCFIAGVLAIPLDYLLSGFNIATNISAYRVFSAMVGFTSEELLCVLDRAAGSGRITSIGKVGLMDLMERRCGGYAFCQERQGEIFNPGQCLALLDAISGTGANPDPALEEASGDDAGMLRTILDLSEDRTKEQITGCVLEGEDIFSAMPGTLSLCDGLLDFDSAVWALYYLGFLAFAPSEHACAFRCPNERVLGIFRAAAS